ncbi:hypothetical protein HN807_08610 [Candidatus Bathyarchaeota archaeon]|nr:hypothetical protein [Candidatus Bathyarchaeota archaeon]MBT6604071.1 hypothetical protein [Candidatus Bathyarchaeota archaeon]MBT7188471.1 hypothetical protein [Candidatus Bathyarchaeota archaeon]MBT7347128.1 hypothetical protein [Candidatus Bathyarchaeota archaeon]
MSRRQRTRRRRRRLSPMVTGIVIVVMLVIFWNLLATYEGGEFIDFNETDENMTSVVEVIFETTLWIDKGKYEMFMFEVRRGDNLNITVSVLDGGGPIDYFVMEERKKLQFDGWLNGTEVKFYAYDNAKALNITYSNILFTIPRTDRWYLILNNYGHMLEGAYPMDEVHLYVKVENVGFTVEQSFG